MVFSPYDRIIRLQVPDIASLDPDKPNYQSLLGDVLNWINYMHTPKQLKQYYLAELANTNQVIPNIENVDDFNFVSLGKHAYIRAFGGKVRTSPAIEANVKKVKALAAELGQFDELNRIKASNNSAAMVNRRQLNAAVESIQDIILSDNWVNDPIQITSITSTLSKTQLEELRQTFELLHREVSDTTDPDYAENIELMGARAAKNAARFSEFLAILSGRHIKAKERNTRKHKNPTADKLTKNIKHKELDNEFKIASINPSDIIGASGLLVFNTKTHRIGVYRAETGKTLGMRGTTLQNFDTAGSIAKTLRKPEKDLSSFKEAPGLKRIDVMFSTYIRGKTYPMNGRINKDTILMRAFK